MKFSLDEQVEEIHLCGCKLTQTAPFCDGTTCLKVLKDQSFEEAQNKLDEEREQLESARRLALEEED